VSGQPLAGRRVLVSTRRASSRQAQRRLARAGSGAVEVAVLEIRPPESLAALDAALRQLDSYDWLILTSANAVRALAERAAALEIALTQPVRLKVAAIGEATAAGGAVDWIAGGFCPGGLRR